MRVLIFTNSVTMGGMEEHVALLARHLDRSLFEVFAVCPRWQPAERLQQMLANSADHLAVSTPDRRWGLLSMIWETVRLHRRLRTWQIDVVHMHSTTYRGQVFALIGCWAAGVRRVYVTEHLAPDAALPRPERWLRNLFSAAVTGIVCVSQKNLEARRAYIYTPSQRTTVVENGIDVGKFEPIAPDELSKLRVRYDIPPEAPIVGTAVRFEPDKGLDDLIAAMPAIRAACPDVHFLLVGDGSLRKDLEAQVARLNMTDRVHFTGFQDDPRAFLGLMDVFVLPVPVGSMSIGLLEAMAMERTVVMTFGGDGEAVIDGESGFCATPRDPASIARFTTKALLDPELRRRVGRAARQRVTDHFSAQRVADALGALYRQQET
jgi:glycosyltransferase involved in cell wall biosynthesis